LLARAKTLGVADDQHEGQCGQGADSGMRHQPLRLRTLLDFLLDRLGQFRDRRVQSIHQLQQIASSPAGPRSQRKRFQLLASLVPPQPLLAAQSFIERHRLQFPRC
jgi:hypothetical protein